MNKVKFGLRNVVYAKMTYNEEENIYTYATPVSIPGAVNLSLSPSGDSNDFYADDIIYFADSNNNGYEGDLEIAIIPDSFKKDILGETEDANKVLFENAEDKTDSLCRCLLLTILCPNRKSKNCFFLSNRSIFSSLFLHEYHL